ncbi:hypothetical protein VC83_08558 [Pseudogymnoascus destructans]|uniref:Zn(2)-C6 fungal-type domain-containing protein n=2 Tax=Pseudogymnoascus destructans TaxID=655981 RepID=L8FRA4_PSED2|nr:uncharacterized protein VC83_08558 [Pseudogymnoascus destructans]ELR03069.1 hypothetical protein GMDG_05913 [Pseudogymnoascus destructans 20631-21]OAF54996.1 hypothetical protein VC83_08558 [Pseudogymnoascus destructans]
MSPSRISNDGNDEHRDKRVRRVRKGTRSCWECKRRKIRCIFGDDSEPTCKGCLDRGTSCVSQEFLDDAERPSSNNTGLGHRLGRVEELLEKLITKVSPSLDRSTPVKEADSLQAASSCIGIDVIVPTDEGSHTEYGNAPIMSLFDDSVLSRPPVPQQGRQMPTPGSTTSCSSMDTCNKIDTVRRTLYRLLPSQADCELLTSRANEWWYLNKYLSQLTIQTGDRPYGIPTVVVEETRAWHPAAIARHLLALCLCVQQSSEGSKLKALEMPAPSAWMEKCLTIITNIVTSDDELVGNVEGLECLILLGGFQINVGNLRRAWLSFRRALNIAQLMGLHRSPAKNKRDSTIPLSPEDIHRSYIYYHLLKGDVYLTLLLGLPPAVAKDPYAGQPEGAYDSLSKEELYIKELSTIALRVIERNSSGESNAYAETQQIDEALETLKQTMLPCWWHVPTTQDYMKKMNSNGVTKQMERLLGQLWHYQIETLVHLPFMLRSATDRRYDYSKICCLNACRELILRWLLLRKCGDQPFICHIVDFQAFMSARIILLGLMGTPGQGILDPTQRDQDRRMVDDLIKSLENTAFACSFALGKQCADVLKTLISTDLNGLTGNLRLKVPYFGVLTLVSGAQAANLEKQSPITPASLTKEANEPTPRPPVWVDTPGMGETMVPAPVLSFASMQFPGMDETGIDGGLSEWQFRDSDIRVFDSLANTDVEGNWGFGAV